MRSPGGISSVQRNHRVMGSSDMETRIFSGFVATAKVVFSVNCRIILFSLEVIV